MRNACQTFEYTQWFKIVFGLLITTVACLQKTHKKWLTQCSKQEGSCEKAHFGRQGGNWIKTSLQTWKAGCQEREGWCTSCLCVSTKHRWAVAVFKHCSAFPYLFFFPVTACDWPTWFQPSWGEGGMKRNCQSYLAGDGMYLLL